MEEEYLRRKVFLYEGIHSPPYPYAGRVDLPGEECEDPCSEEPPGPYDQSKAKPVLSWQPGKKVQKSFIGSLLFMAHRLLHRAQIPTSGRPVQK